MLKLAVTLAAAAALASAPPATAKEPPGHVHSPFAMFDQVRIEDLDVAPDGRIVAAGRDAGGPAHQPWVRAYRADGSADPGFGDAGIVRLERDWRYVIGAHVQRDGRIVVGQNGAWSEPYTHVIRRLTPAGQPDPSFGGDGSIEPDLGGRGSMLTAIALQPDGRLVVAGARNSTDGFVIVVVARHLADGSPDPSFGDAGVREILAGGELSDVGVAVAPDGGLIVTAVAGGLPVIARLQRDGGLDPSFGGGAIAPVQYGRSTWADEVIPPWQTAPPVLLEDGRIRLAQTFEVPSDDPYVTKSRIGIVGLTARGKPDLRFGRNGRALGPLFSQAPGESVSTALRDDHGGILVAGTFRRGDDLDGPEFALIRRFRANGVMDRSFGRDGVVRLDVSHSSYAAIELRLALLGDRLVVSQHDLNAKYQIWSLGTLRTVFAGYDLDDPVVSLVAGCRFIRVRARDASGVDRIVVRAGRRVVRRSGRRSLRVRVPGGARRAVVTATDLAGNSARERTPLPRC